MAFVYFTESRLVPMYQSNPKTAMVTPASVDLNPQAKVETADDQDSYNLIAAPYVQVQVTLGTAASAQPAWWPNGWILRKFLRKCLKKNNPSAQTGETFTGVSYGDYKFKSAVESPSASARFVAKKEQDYKPPKGPPVYKVGFVCASCGRLTADHRLYETQSLRALAQGIVTAHGVQEAATMFGILDVRESNGTNRQMVVAESGFSFHFAGTVQAQQGLFNGVAHHYVTQLDVTNMASYLDCAGNAVQANGQKFSCAAPKLVQYYAHNLRNQYQAPILYMTEVAGQTQGIYVKGHTAESCDTCRNAIPGMLCGLTNLERQVAQGRYPKRQRP